MTQYPTLGGLFLGSLLLFEGEDSSLQDKGEVSRRFSYDCVISWLFWNVAWYRYHWHSIRVEPCRNSVTKAGHVGVFCLRVIVLVLHRWEYLGRVEKKRKEKRRLVFFLSLSAEVSTILPFVAYVREILHRGNASCVGEDRFTTMGKRCRVYLLVLLAPLSRNMHGRGKRRVGGFPTACTLVLRPPSKTLEVPLPW